MSRAVKQQIVLSELLTKGFVSNVQTLCKGYPTRTNRLAAMICTLKKQNPMLDINSYTFSRENGDYVDCVYIMNGHAGASRELTRLTTIYKNYVRK